MTIQVQICGDPFNISGYSSALRDHIQAFVSAGIEVRLTQQLVNADRIELNQWWKDNLPEMMKPLSPKRIALHYMIAEHYKPIADIYNIGFAYWELSKINDTWVNQMNAMDEIWSACNFALNVFKDCGVNKPMFKANWPLDSRWLQYNESELIHPFQENQFIFFSMGELTERKNFADLIAAYTIEFQDEAVHMDGTCQDQGTLLAIKTYHGLHNDINKRHVVQTITSYRDRLQVKVRPAIAMIIEVLSQSKMAAFMNSTHCFVYPTKGEGMGGPAIQMMALGKPIIAPYHTAIQEYHVSPWRIGYSTEPVHSMNHIPAYQNTNAEWYRPDISSLRRCMREAYEMWKTDKDAWGAVGQEGREFVKDNLNYKRIGESMQARLEEI